MSYFDPVIQREVCDFPYKGKQWRFPKIVGDRYEVVRLLTVSGFGALLVANDTWIFNRKVLIKTGFIEAHQLSVRNNASIPDLVEKVNKQYEHEYQILLLAQMRQISGIPTLIDWCKDVSPMIRGPHIDENGCEIFHNDPDCWKNLYYLVLNYFDGKQLDIFCKSKPPQIVDKPNEFFRFLSLYLVDVLAALHKKQDVGHKVMYFIYQDLKPANILISPSEKRYCLIDFGGVATWISGASLPVNPGIYTEEFAPPEAQDGQLDPENSIKPTWDIYTLGTTIRKCIKLADVDAKCSKELHAFLDKCTASEIENRFQNMHQVNEALRQI